jgi:hypothetical protein
VLKPLRDLNRTSILKAVELIGNDPLKMADFEQQEFIEYY